MKKEIILLIAAAFAANSEAKSFHADANGHCFAHGNAETTPVNREDFEKEIAELEGDSMNADAKAIEAAAESRKNTKNKK